MVDAPADASPPWAFRRSGEIVTNDDAVWPWWSITKTVLAAAALHLHDERRVDLEAPTRFHPATLRQLLAHTGGVPSYTRLAAYTEAVEKRAPAWPVEAMLARMASEDDDFPPGHGWAYSNTSYTFVRCMIEEAMGEPIERALARLVLEPLGLHSTAIVVSVDDDHCPMLRAERYDPAWVYHGLACGPAGDAVRLLDGILGTDFLRPETRSLLTDRIELGGAVANRPWTSAAYGLGAMCGTMVGHGRVVGHSGGGPFSVAAVYRVDTENDAHVASAFGRGCDEGHAEWIVQKLLENGEDVPVGVSR